MSTVGAMKAAVLEQIPGSLVIDDVQIGRVGPHEVLVQTAAAGLCHSDLHFMEGKYPHPTPAVLGHESAGVVEAVGSQVTYLQPGDHVISCISGFCGACRYCLSGRPNLCDKVGLSADPDGPPRLRRGDQPVFQFADLASFAEQLLVHEHLLVKIRPDMPLDKAALIGCGVTTGVGAVLNTAAGPAGRGRRGDRVRRRRAERDPGRRHRRRRPRHRRRHRRRGSGTSPSSSGPPTWSTRRPATRSLAVLEMTGGGVDHAFEAIGLPATARAGVQHAGQGRHRHGDRHDPDR